MVSHAFQTCEFGFRRLRECIAHETIWPVSDIPEYVEVERFDARLGSRGVTKIQRNIVGFDSSLRDAPLNTKKQVLRVTLYDYLHLAMSRRIYYHIR